MTTGPGTATAATPFRYFWEKTVRDAGMAKGEGGVSVLAIALVLATYANADGTKVYPGVARLAKGAGVSDRTVDRALARLRAEGYVIKVREGNSRAGKADEYRLALPDRPSTATGHGSEKADDHPTRSAVQPTPVLNHPTRLTRSPDVGGVPPAQGPDHYQPISTSTRTAPTARPTSGGWGRARQQATQEGDFVASPVEAPSPFTLPSQLAASP